MGYYTGNGIYTGGSDTTAIAATALVGTTLNVIRRDIRSVVVKRGVSEAVAKAAESSLASTSGNVTWGSWAYPLPNRSGTNVNVSRARIGDTNLFELTIETVEYHSRLNSGNWDS